VVRYVLVLYGMVRYGTVWFGIIWYDVLWDDIDVVWYGTVGGSAMSRDTIIILRVSQLLF
jgi:hypothetical protein